MPHPGCDRGPCAAARRGERPAEKVACLGITDGRRGWLLDATPDFPAQCHALGVRVPDGVFLTHAHLGHYLGLAYLGKEALGARGVPVHATARMAAFLRGNDPWRRLVSEGRIDLREGPADLGGVRVSPFPVPHRDELSDTVGYLVEGPRRRVLWIPDIDDWARWDRDIRAAVEGVDLAFLDATFLSDGELGGRSMEEVPHPRALDTMARLAGLGDRVRLVHLNHTNPLLEDPGPARERGFAAAREGEAVPL
jgi:pyrroloquinoline quinone biosynthesis protein B